MRLGDKQRLFASLLPRLIDAAHQMGFSVTVGHVYRSPEEAHRLGFPGSLHCLKLAVDLNLFRMQGGRMAYLTSTESHRQLGEWWEQQHELCSWGGRFGDGNHYSLRHGGRR